MRSAKLLVSAVALLLATLVFAKVSVDYDDTVSFTQYKTYAWKKGTPASDSLIQAHIVNAIDAELASKDFTKTNGKPDLYLVVHASTKKHRLQLQDRPLGLAARHRNSADRDPDGRSAGWEIQSARMARRRYRDPERKPEKPQEADRQRSQENVQALSAEEVGAGVVREVLVHRIPKKTSNNSILLGGEMACLNVRSWPKADVRECPETIKSGRVSSPKQYVSITTAREGLTQRLAL
ncbi:MAG: DUF4136 domain-containing protein [Gammaproteobacteria bacterium]